MLIRIDGRRLTDAAGMHAALKEALGFPDVYGNNLDALIDCLTHIDDPDARMTRVNALPGEFVVFVIENAYAPSAEQVRSLMEVVAFVNWRRLEKGGTPVLSIASVPN